MKIPLIEPASMRYVYINYTTNRVHLFVPVIAGQHISTDNTCKLKVELKAFFDGGAVSELESYKSLLELHISLLKKGDDRYNARNTRLTQIIMYLDALDSMRNNYMRVVDNLLSQPSNLYSIQLRPSIQDYHSMVVNPVFTINRSNHDATGIPLSCLYNKMHEIFPTLVLGKPDPHTKLINSVLNALPKDASIEDIQALLAKQCNVPGDFFKRKVIPHLGGYIEIVVDKVYIDLLMRHDKDTTATEYIAALLGVCAPNLQTTQQGSPFYLGTSSHADKEAERLSILMQFYLGVMNVYCRAKGISDKNFGDILDNSSELSSKLVNTVSKVLSDGGDVEHSLVTFFNVHKKTFFNIINQTKFYHELSRLDKEAIQSKFEIAYRTVTATSENPHMDDFMLLDTEAGGENNTFFTHQGLICTDFANIASSTGPNQQYFEEIRKASAIHFDIITPQNEPVITVDIEPEVLLNKVSDVEWDKLPKEIVDACYVLPAFKVRPFLDDVAKGKQNEADMILQSSADIQTLLRTTGKVTDYSGRTFHCTAYEYAYWAKDTHMCRMLERHMDDETKAILLEKVEELEHSGLAYQQHGKPYQNPHYDMSFVLKDLSPEEFQLLQTIVDLNNTKIQQATNDNYKTIAFTATEYKQLKDELAQKKVRGFIASYSVRFQRFCYLAYPELFILSFFITSPTEKLSAKLQFDFHSLITALEFFVNNYAKSSYRERDMAWYSVGMAQRDVPAHIAHEYRLFGPMPNFNEGTPLTRSLALTNFTTNEKAWFPLTSLTSGLGFNFALTRGWVAFYGDGYAKREATTDLVTTRLLDQVRINDLVRSRENLSQPALRPGYVIN